MFNSLMVKYLCGAAGIAALALALPAQAGDDLVIKTDQGKVQGKMSADGQARDFLGIPFAAPPVGPLRWKPPQPAAKWHGVRQATSFGSRCMQQEHFDDMVFRDPGESEDCLTLNVWTPAGQTQGQTAGNGLDFWRRVCRWGHLGAASGRRTPHPQRRAGGLHELPAGHFWIPRHPGVGRRGSPSRSRQLRAAGPIGLPAVGAAQHQPPLVATRQCDHLRRIRRFLCRQRADGIAAGARVCLRMPSGKAAERLPARN